MRLTSTNSTYDVADHHTGTHQTNGKAAITYDTPGNVTSKQTATSLSK